MSDPNQVSLIGGVVIAFLLTFFIPAILQSRKSRISRFFKSHEGVRYQIVTKLSKNPSSLPNDLSHTEMVAVLMAISIKETVSDAFTAAQRFSAMGWSDQFNDEFFDRLNITARKFASKQWNRDSLDLFRIGQMIAKANNFPIWECEFSESINRLRYQRVQSGLPTRQI